MVEGPVPRYSWYQAAPDTVLMRARAKGCAPGEFDLVAMYQGKDLLPVKYRGVDKCVNVTLGLPQVRTSPDHGTAFDIAGTGRAEPGQPDRGAAHGAQPSGTVNRFFPEYRGTGVAGPLVLPPARRRDLRARPVGRSRGNAQWGCSYFFRLSRISRSRMTSSGVGAGADGAASSLRFRRLICLTIIKMMKARMTKLTATVMKLP